MKNTILTLLAKYIPAGVFAALGIDIIITHNGRFHADEVTALNLWKSFINKRIMVIRTFDKELYSLFKQKGFIFFDVGREYDVDRLLFDHHHFVNGTDQDAELSSAGLVLRYIKNQGHHVSDELSELIHHVDMNDVGIKSATRQEYSYLLSLYNSKKNFDGAMAFAKMTIEALIKKEEFLISVQETIDKMVPFADFKHVFQLEWACRETGELLVGETYPDVLASITEGPCSRTGDIVWSINLTNKNNTSYEAHGIRFREIKEVEMNFVHSAGFLAVANSREDAIKFLIANGYI